MNVLVTGASGFIGKRLLSFLEDDAAITRIFIVTHKVTKFDLQKAHTLIRSDDLENLDARIDKIIHLAQDPNYRAFPERANSIFDCNLRLTQILLDLAVRSKASQFIYFSSGSIYDLSQSPLNEDTAVRANDYYSFTKLASEQLCNLYSKFFGCSVIRLFNPYGPNLGDKFLTRIKNQIKNEQPVFVYPGKSFEFNPIHVDDICAITMAILKKSIIGTYNLGGTEIVDFKKVIDCFAKLMNKKTNIQESLNANKFDMVAYPAKLLSQVDYTFKISLEDGLKDFIETN